MAEKRPERSGPWVLCEKSKTVSDSMILFTTAISDSRSHGVAPTSHAIDSIASHLPSLSPHTHTHTHTHSLSLPPSPPLSLSLPLPPPSSLVSSPIHTQWQWSPTPIASRTGRRPLAHRPRVPAPCAFFVRRHPVVVASPISTFPLKLSRSYSSLLIYCY